MEKEKVIVRHIDDLGRVVIPKAIRQKFNIDEGDALKIEVDERTGSFIMISKWVESVTCDSCQDEIYNPNESTAYVVGTEPKKYICDDCWYKAFYDIEE